MNKYKNLITLLESTNERAFSNWEIALFKSLNKRKGKLQTKKDYQNYISSFLEVSGMSPKEALYYYYVYTINYRPDGNYEDIKKGEQQIPGEGIKPARTSNYNMRDFAQNKIPFKGNNVEGFWERDSKGEPQYVITSYNWYPIFIFKAGKWYKASESYSKSTGKQMGQTGVYHGSNYLSPRAMKELRTGRDIEDIRDEQKKLVSSELSKILKDKPYNFVTVYLHGGPNNPSGSYRIKFATNFVDQQDEKFVIDLDVLEIASLDTRGSIISRISDDLNDDTLKKQINYALNDALTRKLDTGIKDAADFDLNVNFKL